MNRTLSFNDYPAPYEQRYGGFRRSLVPSEETIQAGIKRKQENRIKKVAKRRLDHTSPQSRDDIKEDDSKEMETQDKKDRRRKHKKKRTKERTSKKHKKKNKTRHHHRHRKFQTETRL